MAPGGSGLRSGRLCGPVFPVHAIGRASVQRAMRPEVIIEVDVVFEPLLRVTNRLVRVEIDLLLLEASPETLHKDVIPPPAAAIHTDLDALVSVSP